MSFGCEKQLLNAKDLPQKISVCPFSITAHPELRVTVALEPIPAGFRAEAGLHPGQVASSSAAPKKTGSQNSDDGVSLAAPLRFPARSDSY